MKRRDFIIKSSVASSSILLPSMALGQHLKPFTSNDTINIGVIGTGDRGSGLISVINNIDNLNVIACADVLPFRLKNGIATAQEKTKGYKDYRKLLDNKDIDAVIVATPFNTHSKIAIDTIDAGKHVYCEKTMAMGYKGIKELVAKEKNANTIFQSGHQYRSSRLYTHVVDLIKNGKIGKIQSFECQWNRNGNWRRPVPKPELEKIINWRMYREFSGGLLAELCSHQLDFVNWVMEDTPQMVTGVGGVDYWKDGRETFDNIHLIYSYPKGVKATFTCLTANAKDGYKIKVLGDKGTITLDYAKAWFYPENRKKKKTGHVDGVAGATIEWDEDKGSPIHIEHKEPTEQALIDFKDNIQNNETPLSDITTGANSAFCVQMGLDAVHNNIIITKN